jgi:hypothetical protein
MKKIRKTTRWISVKESLPTKNDRYIVGRISATGIGETTWNPCIWNNGEWVHPRGPSFMVIRKDAITHWLEIPEIFIDQ